MDLSKETEESKNNHVRRSIVTSIICISFNQDKSWMACGTTTGFRVYDTTTMKMIDSNERENFRLNSGVSAISLLNKTILVALVTDGLNSHQPNTKVFLWDKYTKEPKKEFKHTNKVDEVYLAARTLFSLSQDNIFIWDLEKASIEQIISTSAKPHTFLVNSLNKSSIVLVHQNEKKNLSVANINSRVDISIKPEVEEIQLMALSDDATLLAIVDESGCYIYVYNTGTGKLEYEFVRGKTSCVTSCMQFSSDNKYLALINDKLTLHIFKLEEKYRIKSETKVDSIFDSFVSYMPKLLSAPKSFAQYHPSSEKGQEVSWIDTIRGRIKGPFFHFKNSDTPIKIFFASGNCNLVKFNPDDGGECIEIIENMGTSWYDPFGDEKLEDDDYIVI